MNFYDMWKRQNLGPKFYFAPESAASGGTTENDAILAAIKGLGADFGEALDGVKTEFNTITDEIRQKQSEFWSALGELKTDVDALKATPVNAPVPVAPGEDVAPNGTPHFNLKKHTKLGWADEQNQAFEWYMRRGDKKPASKTGLMSPTFYEYVRDDEGRLTDVKTYVDGTDTVPLEAKYAGIKNYTDLDLDSVKQITGLSPEAGGILIPRDHLRAIIAKRDERAVMRLAGARIKQTNLRTVDVPVEDTRQALFTIVGEGSLIPDDTPNFEAKTPTVSKFAKIIKVSEEELADEQSGLVPWLMEGAGRAMALTENSQFFVGTGNGTTGPQGIIPAVSTGPTAASATALAAGDIFALFYNNVDYLDPATTWVMNPTIEQLVRAISGADFSFVPKTFNQAGTTWGRIRDLLGQPLLTTKYMATLAVSSKIVILADFYSSYLIIDRMGVEVRLLRERYAENALVGYRFIYRNTGIATNVEGARVLTTPAS